MPVYALLRKMESPPKHLSLDHIILPQGLYSLLANVSLSFARGRFAGTSRGNMTWVRYIPCDVYIPISIAIIEAQRSSHPIHLLQVAKDAANLAMAHPDFIPLARTLLTTVLAQAGVQMDAPVHPSNALVSPSNLQQAKAQLDLVHKQAYLCTHWMLRFRSYDTLRALFADIDISKPLQNLPANKDLLDLIGAQVLKAWNQLGSAWSLESKKEVLKCCLEGAAADCLLPRDNDWYRLLPKHIRLALWPIWGPWRHPDSEEN